MDERYNNVRVTEGEGEIMRTLFRLKYTPRAQRIHTLHLKLDAIAKYLIQQPVLALNHTQRSHSFISEPCSLAGRAELLLHTIDNMSQVRELDMSTHTCPTSPRMRALEFCTRITVACAWSTFGSTLRSLTLAMAYEGYVYALAPTFVFPCLEELNIDIGCYPNSLTNDEGTKLICDSLIPFINNHHHTLQSLGLSFGSHRLPNISSHLTAMNYLPHLRNINIFDVSTKSDDSGLRHILEIHSDNLLGLCLNFGPKSRSPHAEWTIFHVALPHLESLELGHGCFLNLGLTAAYLQQFRESLTAVTLDLNDGLFFRDTGIMMDALVKLNALRKLYFSVTNISPELLDLLATKLPSLTFVKLYFENSRHLHDGSLVNICKIVFTRIGNYATS